MESYLVFHSDGRNARDVEIRGDGNFLLWRPSLWHPRPPATHWKSTFWSLVHYLQIFRNRDYAALSVVQDGRVVHRSSVIPACFRWPFMDEFDLQISNTWTAPDLRGQGLATLTLEKMLFLFRRPGRRFWYITRVDNGASMAVCRKAGLSLAGAARRVPRLRVRVLGKFELDCNPDHPEAARRIA